MLSDRQKIYRVLEKDGRTKSYADENAFFQKYFISENSVLNLYNFLKSHNHKVGNRAGQVYVNYDETTFFKKYVCGDLSWANNSRYCVSSGGGGNTSTSNTQLKYSGCPETLPVKKFCKNKIVGDVQRCLRDKHQMDLKDDEKFGPKTEKALIKLGLKGNVITSKEYNIACSPTDLGQSSKPNVTGYDDYSNDEYEDSSEKPEQEFSTGYEDYTLEEN